MSTQNITQQVTPFIGPSEIRCYMGTDYTEALGNALHFTCSTWTNLASGSVKVRRLDDSAFLDGVLVTSGIAGTEQEVYFELEQDSLALLGRGRHNLRLFAVLGSAEYALHDFWVSVI